MKPQDRIITFQDKLIEENLDVTLLTYSRNILYYTGSAQPSYLAVQPENFRLFVRSGLDFALQEVFIDRGKIEEERRLDNIRKKIFFGGTVAPKDIPVLKKAGIAEVFGPGTPLKKIVEFISAAATDLK